MGTPPNTTPSKTASAKTGADSIELSVEKLIYGGEGLGHHDGRTVFVPFVLPGETVAVEPVERRKKFIRGRVVQILKPAPQRVAPSCPYFEVCGGCNYQHIGYQAQLRFKSDILRETLARLGRIEWTGPIATHASPPYAYRNRAQWKVGFAADGAAAGAAPAIGYYQAGSQKLCPVRECPVSSPRVVEALLMLSNLLAAGELPPSLREAEAFADDADAKLLLNLSFDRLESPASEIAAKLQSALPAIETLLVHDRRADRFELVGPGTLTYRVGDYAYQVGHLSFFQVNRFVLPQMVDLLMADAHGGLALDLFAGVGLFSVPLAHRFERLIAVESNDAAARDLEANLRESGAPSPAFRPATVEAFLERWKETPDLVVLDPPRAGVAPQALQRLIKLAPQRIAYFSCDPATLARDLVLLVGTAAEPGKYQMSEVHLVDIFPQSYHMEAFVKLSRRE